jgi:hypothetical protein
MAGDSSGNDAHHPERVLDRRGFVKLAGTAGAGLTLGPLLAACGSSSGSDGGSIKIGYVSPETGPLAGFGEADKFVIGALKKQFADGVKTGGDTRKIEVLIRDSQSNSNRAASVTNDLILNDNVNLVLVEGTPDNINPWPTRARPTARRASPRSRRGSRTSSGARARPRSRSSGPTTSSGASRT